jgi:hypothetical protein
MLVLVFSCEITYKDWTSGDDPMTVHRRLSPSCVIVRHNRQNMSSTIDNQEMERAPTQTSNQYQHSNGYATQEVLKKQEERVSCYGQIVLCLRRIILISMVRGKVLKDDNRKSSCDIVCVVDLFWVKKHQK